MTARKADPAQVAVRADLVRFFEQHPEGVFFSRQIEVIFEDRHFHWITNRALRELVEEGLLGEEVRALGSGAEIHIMWPRRSRYYKRAAKRLVGLVNEYAAPDVAAAVGLQGEALVLEGFARKRFVLEGRHTKEFRDKIWTKTNHRLDFIFERDSMAYGVEVKNMLGYMEQDEFRTKIEMCEQLGIRPVIVARMLPRTWIHELQESGGGFALILKYQLYPWGFRDLARKVRHELGLPVDSPRALEDGTMQRFVDWHERRS